MRNSYRVSHERKITPDQLNKQERLYSSLLQQQRLIDPNPFETKGSLRAGVSKLLEKYWRLWGLGESIYWRPAGFANFFAQMLILLSLRLWEIEALSFVMIRFQWDGSRFLRKIFLCCKKITSQRRREKFTIVSLLK